MAIRGHCLPVKERVSPPLPGLGVCIGGHARHVRRSAVIAEQEHALIRPHIDAVLADVDRDITDHSNAARGGVPPDFGPLPFKQKQCGAPNVHLGFPSLKGGSNGLGLVTAKFFGPLPPGPPAVRLLQRVKLRRIACPSLGFLKALQVSRPNVIGLVEQRLGGFQHQQAL